MHPVEHVEHEIIEIHVTGVDQSTAGVAASQEQLRSRDRRRRRLRGRRSSSGSASFLRVAAASGTAAAGLFVALAALFAGYPHPRPAGWIMLGPGVGSVALLDVAPPAILVWHSTLAGDSFSRTVVCGNFATSY